MELRLNGTPLPRPGGVKVGRFEISKASRTASGLMVKEIIAVKRRVDVSWSHIAAPDLEAVLAVIESGGPYYRLEYEDPAGLLDITVYVGDIEAEAWHTVGGVRYWRDVTIPFIER